jgi:hypothetical protein
LFKKWVASFFVTGSRIKRVDTGAHGATFGARVEMGKIKKSDSGANKSQVAQQADIKTREIGGQGSIAQQGGNSSTSQNQT